MEWCRAIARLPAKPLLLSLAGLILGILVLAVYLGVWRAASPMNCVLITLDTVRADRLGCYGNAKAVTPYLDELASEGILFARARVQTPLTLPSHVSLMTGTYPTWHGVATNGQKLTDHGVQTLAEDLAQSGYRTGAVVGSFVLSESFGFRIPSIKGCRSWG